MSMEAYQARHPSPRRRQSLAATRQGSGPLGGPLVRAYHVIFGTYGFWLPNDERGSWSNFVGSWELLRFGKATTVRTRRSLARRPSDPVRRAEAKKALKYPAVALSGVQARAVARGFAAYAAQTNLSVLACAILPEHVHCVCPELSGSGGTRRHAPAPASGSGDSTESQHAWPSPTGGENRRRPPNSRRHHDAKARNGVGLLHLCRLAMLYFAGGRCHRYHDNLPQVASGCPPPLQLAKSAAYHGNPNPVDVKSLTPVVDLG